MSSTRVRLEAEVLDESQGRLPDVLRVVLDEGAAKSYERMAKTLRGEGFVKVSPSRFVSFLMNLFYASHFDKDKELLLSEFFDSKAFIEDELKKATDPSEIGVAMERVMLTVRRMQDLKKRGMKAVKARDGGVGER